MNKGNLLNLDNKNLFGNRREAFILYAVIVLLSSGIFYADFLTERGIVVWVLYLIPLTLSYLSWRPTVPFILSALVTCFMILNYYTDARGIDRELAQLNRLLGLAGIWINAGVGFFYIRNKISVKTEEILHLAEAKLAELVAGEKIIMKSGMSF